MAGFCFKSEEGIPCQGLIVGKIGDVLVVEGMAQDSGSYFLKFGDTARRFYSRKEAEDYGTELAQDATPAPTAANPGNVRYTAEEMLARQKEWEKKNGGRNPQKSNLHPSGEGHIDDANPQFSGPAAHIGKLSPEETANFMAVARSKNTTRRDEDGLGRSMEDDDDLRFSRRSYDSWREDAGEEPTTKESKTGQGKGPKKDFRDTDEHKRGLDAGHSDTPTRPEENEIRKRYGRGDSVEKINAEMGFSIPTIRGVLGAAVTSGERLAKDRERGG